LLRGSIEEAAEVMLQDGKTSPAVQQSEIALRSAMLGLTRQQVMAPETIFDYAPVVEAAGRLQSSHWTPTE
jgi:hypothetical protein